MVVKDIYVRANEAREERVNIHHPDFYLWVNPPAKNTSAAASWPELMSRDTAARSLNTVIELNLVHLLADLSSQAKQIGKNFFLIR